MIQLLVCRASELFLVANRKSVFYNKNAYIKGDVVNDFI
jgi:hypothetical protein